MYVSIWVYVNIDYRIVSLRSIVYISRWRCLTKRIAIITRIRWTLTVMRTRLAWTTTPTSPTRAAAPTRQPLTIARTRWIRTTRRTTAAAREVEISRQAKARRNSGRHDDTFCLRSPMNQLNRYIDDLAYTDSRIYLVSSLVHGTLLAATHFLPHYATLRHYIISH